VSSKPLVSVITIFLNAEKFIEEAIESVFSQTHDNWELLLVDDGSFDASTQIARRYADRYPEKVRYFEHDDHRNRGMSASRNLGISNGRGEYIAFLDADDVWLPHKLEEQVAILCSHPEAAMVYGRTRIWFSWTDSPEDTQRDYMTELGVQPNSVVEPPTLLTLFLRDENSYYPCTCSVLIRREVFEEIGRFKEDFRGGYEDMVFHSKVFLEAPVFVAGECWDQYRQHPDSCWAVARKTGQHHLYEPNPLYRSFLDWLTEYLFEKGVKDTKLWKALQKELWPYHHPRLYRLFAAPRHLIRWIKRLAKQIGRRTLPVPVRLWLRANSS